MKIQIPHTTSQKGMSRLAHEMVCLSNFLNLGEK